MFLYSSRAPGLTSGLQGSVNVHRGVLLLVPHWQCISSFVFYFIHSNTFLVVNSMLEESYKSCNTFTQSSYVIYCDVTLCLPSYLCYASMSFSTPGGVEVWRYSIRKWQFGQLRDRTVPDYQADRWQWYTDFNTIQYVLLHNMMIPGKEVPNFKNKLQMSYFYVFYNIFIFMKSENILNFLTIYSSWSVTLRYPMYNRVFLHSAWIVSIVKYSKFHAWKGMINFIFSERSWCSDTGYMTLRAQYQRGETFVELLFFV